MNHTRISRRTLFRYKKRMKLTKVNAKVRPTKRWEHGMSLRNAVSQFLLFDSLLHPHELDPEWTVYSANVQSVDCVLRQRAECGPCFRDL